MCICTSPSCPHKNTHAEHSKMLRRVVVIRVRLLTGYAQSPHHVLVRYAAPRAWNNFDNLQQAAARTASLSSLAVPSCVHTRTTMFFERRYVCDPNAFAQRLSAAPETATTHTANAVMKTCSSAPFRASKGNA